MPATRLQVYCGVEHALQLCVAHTLLKGHRQPLGQRPAALFKCEQRARLALLLEALRDGSPDEVAVLGDLRANAVELARVLPSCELRASHALALGDGAESRYPLVVVNHAVFARVNLVKQVLHDWVVWRLQMRALVGLAHQAVEMREAQLAAALLVKLNSSGRMGVHLQIGRRPPWTSCGS